MTGRGRPLARKDRSLMSLTTNAFVNRKETANTEPRLFAAGNVLPFVLVTALFLFWGIPSNMNDILIKQFIKSF